MVYMVLQAKDPAVDKVPQLQLDLDFPDGYGQVILPVTSSVVLVNAANAVFRPMITNADVSQTLDLRKWDDGKLLLDIVIKANGIVPTLDQLIDTSKLIPGLVVESTNDNGLSLLTVECKETIEPVTERSWRLEIKTNAPLEEDFRFLPTVFKPKKLFYKKVTDADMVELKTDSVSLKAGNSNQQWYVAGAGAGVLGVLGWLIFVFGVRRGRTEEEEDELTIPESITAYSTVCFLRILLRLSEWNDEQQLEINREILRIENDAFASEGETLASEDLRAVMVKWHSVAL